MSEAVIQIKNISKKYNINHREGKYEYFALRDVLAEIIKNPFKFVWRKTKDIASLNSKEEFWALKDVNFSVEQGEAIGIIGANGAGKTTLLKILTKITPPATGEIKIKGKVASLLEVGTGFHPELTGRENIFFNGAILGMTKKEISAKFDKIVEFSGVEKFIDTPVKRYSSGMYVRLAFSVAAHMDTDILLIDEVLAVGDAAFQKKCLGKMDEVTKKAGRTIIFISHDMELIRRLCSKAILLKNGRIEKWGKTSEVIDYYLQDTVSENASEYKYDQEVSFRGAPVADQLLKFTVARVLDSQGKLCSKFGTTDDIFVSVEYELKRSLPNLFIDCAISDKKGNLIFHSTDNDVKEHAEKTKDPGIYVSICRIPKNFLNVGRYFIRLDGRIPKVEHFFSVRNALSFEVESTGGPTSVEPPRDGFVCPELEWTINLKQQN